MAEYVDITKLKERIRYDFDYSLQLCEDIIEVTDSLPTIEIVHCENCIHWEKAPTGAEGKCWRSPRHYSNHDDFCSHGAEPLHSVRKE